MKYVSHYMKNTNTIVNDLYFMSIISYINEKKIINVQLFSNLLYIIIDWIMFVLQNIYIITNYIMSFSLLCDVLWCMNIFKMRTNWILQKSEDDVFTMQFDQRKLLFPSFSLWFVSFRRQRSVCLGSTEWAHAEWRWHQRGHSCKT